MKPKAFKWSIAQKQKNVNKGTQKTKREETFRFFRLFLVISFAFAAHNRIDSKEVDEKRNERGPFENALNMKLKRIVGSFLATLTVCLFLQGQPIFAEEDTTPYNWYFKKNDSHEQPPLDSCLEFIKKQDGYYLDEGCKEKVIYLTFDAGYENGNIARILDALERHDAPAAFFVLENLIKRNPELVKRMTAEGHLVCNHTARHPDMSAITDKALFQKQLTALEKCMEEVIGSTVAPFYRPPQGRFTEQNLHFAKEMGYRTVFWSYAYADWDNARQPDPKWAMEQILAHTHPGMVILLHPTSKTNADIMDELLSAWEGEGYRFAPLTELTS